MRLIATHNSDWWIEQSCISEAQKYQGALYRPEKEKKNKPSRNNANNNDHHVVPKKAYVEDAPDYDASGVGNGTVSIVEAPPHAPSPPPAAAAAPVNVFDFLVDQETPNASTVALTAQHHEQQQQQQTPHHQDVYPSHDAGPMMMVAHPRPVFDTSRNVSPLPLNGLNSSKETFGETSYDQTGFHYGQGPVPVAASAYLTPAPNRDRPSRRNRDENGLRTHKKDSSNKRKRVHIEDLDLSAANAGRHGSSSVERGVDDEMMLDAPLPELHTGLTGGLNRMLGSRHAAGDNPPSPDYSGDNIAVGESPGSPLKRSKHASSKVVTTTALVRTKKAASSTTAREQRHRDRDRDRERGRDGDRDERRARKKHRKHRRRSSSHSREGSSSRHHGTNGAGKAMKAIEYPRSGGGDGVDANQLVVYRTRAELFMSFVTKGPDSEKGCSLNKALKRYHRERSGADGRGGLGRGEEEKELWRGLRLRRNEKGEVVIFGV